MADESPSTTPAAPAATAPKPKPPRLTLGRAAVVILVMILALEGGVRLIEKHLPRQTSGDEVEVELKWQQVEQLHDTNQPTDVLFLGNSTMDAGLNPAVFAANSKRFKYPFNGALLGQPMPATDRWANEFVLPIMHPSTVVIGLTPLDIPEADLFGVSRAEVQAAFDQTFDKMRPSPLERIDLDVGSHSALIRNRAAFHSPIEIWRGIVDTIENKPLAFTGLGPTTLPDGKIVLRSESVWKNDILKPRGGDSNYWGATFSGKPSSTLDAASRTLTAENTIDTSQIDQLVTTIRSFGISDIVLVIMPHQLKAIQEAGVNMTEFRRSVSLIKGYGASHHLPVIDFTNNNWPNVDFFDEAHLSHQGSTRFSIELAHILDAE